jgi:hypothetical protein
MATQDDETGPEPVTLVATCRTSGCPSQDQPFVGTYYGNAEPPLYRGLCMGCGQPVSDLATPLIGPVS